MNFGGEKSGGCAPESIHVNSCSPPISSADRGASGSDILIGYGTLYVSFLSARSDSDTALLNLSWSSSVAKGIPVKSSSHRFIMLASTTGSNQVGSRVAPAVVYMCSRLTFRAIEWSLVRSARVVSTAILSLRRSTSR